jgi:4-amino-4-deoxy-L-arabinose transferase-like glycosyltransferase
MQVDLTVMAGVALATWGFAACVREKRWAGAMLGFGVAVGFLGKGLFAPAVIGLTALLLPLFFFQWRTRRYFMQLVVAAAVALPIGIVWPLLLHQRAPGLFDEWLYVNNLGRFTGYSTGGLGATAEPGQFGRTVAWFFFPIWAYVVGALVREGRRGWHLAGMQVGLTLTLVGCIVLATSASLRAVYLLPLIPPLALAGVVALRTPERGLERTLGWFSVVLGLAVAALMWSVWGMLVSTGTIPDWKPITRNLPVPFEMPVSIAAIVAAGALTAGFAALVVLRDRLAAPSLTLWIGALALAWGLAHTLWLPWFEHAKGYRSLFAQVQPLLPRDVGCIVMDGPGESERALVEYYLGVTPRKRFVSEGDCGALLWMANAEKRIHPDWDGTWRRVWGASRPGEKVERFELFLRGPPPS